MDENDIPGLIGDLLRIGTIASVDLASAEATVETGDVTSPPLPWTEQAGAFRTWSPPSIGEQVILLCPEGDIAGGIILRGLFSNSFPAPASDENQHIRGPGGLVISLTPDGIQITAPGGLTINGNVDITGTLTASQDVVGGGISLKTHKHGGVQSGGAQTGAPV
ncbi:MAG: phage baseplate assembly protein V [Sphingobium sp.]